MKTIFTLLILLVAGAGFAQNPYNVTYANVPYTQLTGAASANGTTVWDTKFFTMPLGFTAKLGNTTITKVYTDGTDLYADTTGTSVDLFQSFFAHTTDRGVGTSTSKSPLRYITTGTAPSRIFKYEVANAGFYDENTVYHTMLDSFYFQFWIYEGSNAVELHFGPSKISNPVTYFGTTGLPGFCGYFNVNFSAGSGNKGYFVGGNPIMPVVDSFTSTHPMPIPLYAYPVSGTTYRFTPKSSTGISATGKALEASVYPTVCSSTLRVEMPEEAPASYRILSLSGAPLGEGALQHGVNAIGVAGLPAGMYVLHIRGTAGSAAYRFVKQ